MRPREARALLVLGAREELLAPLARFAGVPDPMLDALPIARDAGLLDAKNGGWKVTGAPSSSHVNAEVALGGEGPARLLAIPLTDAMTGQVDGADVHFENHGGVWTAELPSAGTAPRVELEDAAAFWVVRRAAEIPPPPPQAWIPDPHDGGL